LDLSCNLIDYRQNTTAANSAAITMSNSFAQLPHLNRLDLSGSPLGGCLSIILDKLPSNLQYLALRSCGNLFVF
jgi:hypothetical protein